MRSVRFPYMKLDVYPSIMTFAPSINLSKEGIRMNHIFVSQSLKQVLGFSSKYFFVVFNTYIAPPPSVQTEFNNFLSISLQSD